MMIEKGDATFSNTLKTNNFKETYISDIKFGTKGIRDDF